MRRHRTYADNVDLSYHRQCRQVSPARIDRVRQDLPPGYEVVGSTREPPRYRSGGFGPDWTADPRGMRRAGRSGGRCRDDTRLVRFGVGGIVYAVVTRRRRRKCRSNPALIAECGSGRWRPGTRRNRHSGRGSDRRRCGDAGMATDATTVVEGGTETRSHADTFTADPNGRATSRSSPSSPTQARRIPRSTASSPPTLLVKTVSALRG